MKKVLVFMAFAILLIACGGTPSNENTNAPKPKSMVADEPVDDGKGIGETKNVILNTPLLAPMVEKGKAIYAQVKSVVLLS